MNEIECKVQLAQQRSIQLATFCLALVALAIITAVNVRGYFFEQAQIKAGNCKTADSSGRMIWLPCLPKFEGR